MFLKKNVYAYKQKVTNLVRFNTIPLEASAFQQEETTDVVFGGVRRLLLWRYVCIRLHKHKIDSIFISSVTLVGAGFCHETKGVFARS